MASEPFLRGVFEVVDQRVHIILGICDDGVIAQREAVAFQQCSAVRIAIRRMNDRDEPCGFCWFVWLDGDSTQRDGLELAADQRGLPDRHRVVLRVMRADAGFDMQVGQGDDVPVFGAFVPSEDLERGGRTLDLADGFFRLIGPVPPMVRAGDFPGDGAGRTSKLEIMRGLELHDRIGGFEPSSTRRNFLK